ncbi:hypothetical protein ATANTOWER_009902 [Ataeniobius toweri]|uniref:C-type lectin domain-containing protein n=1 Tax=Ataeniobius toweri TaxID=208326 RepID=A0ABU7AXS7_9TELE|nr:hypothetical protein [Ataeniobius toweri]
MERIIFNVVIVTSACCWCEKYVFVQNQLNWPQARNYCKTHHTDFLALTNKKEEEVFKKYVNDDESKQGWIGIYWDGPSNEWKWSGGKSVTYLTTLSFSDKAKNIYWKKDNWEWRSGDNHYSFFCLNMLVVQEEKTWEDALEFCSKKGTKLTSLLSATESLQAQNEIQPSVFTKQVWIGLRYLGDRWLWVNGDPMPYEAWPMGGDQDHQCPMLRRCGALTKQGVWESRDCQEKLSFICA